MKIEEFCQLFHLGITGKNHLGFENNTLIVNQFKKPKNKAHHLVHVLQQCGDQLASFEGSLQSKMMFPLNQLLNDVDQLKKRYENKIKTLSWKIQRVFFLVLEKLKICPKNPIKQHETETFQALAAFRVHVEEAKRDIIHHIQPDFQALDQDEQEVEILAPDKNEIALMQVRKKPDVKADLEKVFKKPVMDEDQLKNNLTNLAKAWGVEMDGSASSNRLMHYRNAFFNALSPKPIEEGLKLLTPDTKEYYQIINYLEGGGVRDAQIVPFQDAVKEALIYRQPVLVQDLHQLKLADLKDDYPQFIKALCWIGSKEPLKLDACDFKALDFEDLKSMTMSFPVIEELNLKGTNISSEQILEILPNLPYLKELVIDEAQINDVLKQAISIFCLQDVLVNNQVVKVDFIDEQGVIYRHLPYVNAAMQKEFDEIEKNLKNMEGPIEKLATVLKNRVLKEPIRCADYKLNEGILLYHLCSESDIQHGLAEMEAMLLDSFEKNRVDFEEKLLELEPDQYYQYYRQLKNSIKMLPEEHGFANKFHYIGRTFDNRNEFLKELGGYRLIAEGQLPEYSQKIDDLFNQVNAKLALKFVDGLNIEINNIKRSLLELDFNKFDDMVRCLTKNIEIIQKAGHVGNEHLIKNPYDFDKKGLNECNQQLFLIGSFRLTADGIATEFCKGVDDLFEEVKLEFASKVS